MPDYSQNIWKTLAFAARYGHQQLPVLLAMPKTDLLRFVDELVAIMNTEHQPLKEL